MKFLVSCIYAPKYNKTLGHYLELPSTYKKSNNKNEKPKILIVDDEPDINILYHFVLERAGYTVQSYENPLLALSKFIPCYYDAAILDIRMPEMNGLVLYNELRKRDRKVKICFLTAGEVDVKKLVEDKYDELDKVLFFQKPMRNNDLVQMVSRIMTSH
jgi:DNA-binding NtrC family response regulator